jgi:para-aminobenzoate synthetase component 1
MEPEVVFRGGLEALAEAQAWLDARPGREPGEQILAGYFSYELGRTFEPVRLGKDAGEEAVPPIFLAGYRALYRRHRSGRGEVVGSNPKAMQELADRIRHASVKPVPDPLKLPAPRTSFGEAAYLRAVDRIQDYIRAGDVYQVNLSRRLEYAPVDPIRLPILYERLCRQHAAPFSAFLRAGDRTIVSNSPERFLRLNGDRIETCPIKGTRPRGRTPEEDRWLAKELVASAKDRAEQVMIVDLERNDLGRICETGSVRVDRLAELESFANVHHLVSSVCGRVREPNDWVAIFAALFPGGSITGAPKVRAMQIIDEIEPVPRGIYTGAIGMFDAAGGIDLSLAIRTGVARGNRFDLNLGGGIVADSDPHAELAETRDKGASFAALSTLG